MTWSHWQTQIVWYAEKETWVPVNHSDRSNQIVGLGILYSHVIHAESVNSFKTRLDKFWNNQDVFYDFMAELHGPEAEAKC